MIRAVTLLAVLQLISCQDLPADWKKCHTSDPNLNGCLAEAVQTAVLKLGENGAPTLGVKSMDPLEINKIDLQQIGKSNAVSLKLIFRNVRLHGMSKSSVIQFDAHLDRYGLEGETLTPVLLLEADYVMQGQILVLPVTGKGRCNITLNGMNTIHDIRGKRVERDGQVFMELQKYKVSLSPQSMRGYFGNLFNGDKILGESINQVINDNSQLIFNEMKPSLEKDLGNIFLNYANGIFKTVPYDKIFLP